MVDKVVLFLDYQNIYRRARDAFFSHEVDPHWRGQVNPIKLGLLLVARSPFNRELLGVRVYRGLPSNSRDKVGYAAARRQIARWQEDSRVSVIAHPLRYPNGWPKSHKEGEKPKEKGIDVSLAIDFVTMAVRNEYDVGILFSADTDLKPALKFVDGSATGAIGEVAAWRRSTFRDASNRINQQRISLGDNKPFCHWLDRSDYISASDEVDYSRLM